MNEETLPQDKKNSECDIPVYSIIDRFSGKEGSRKRKSQKWINKEVQVLIYLDSGNAKSNRENQAKDFYLESLKDFFFNLALEVIKNDNRKKKGDLLPRLNGSATRERDDRWSKKAA